MPAWWPGRKSTKNNNNNKEQDGEEQYPLSNRRNLSKSIDENKKKIRGKDSDKKAKSFDEVVISRYSPRTSRDYSPSPVTAAAAAGGAASGGGGGGNYSSGSSSGFSGFGSDRGHPLPQPSNLSSSTSLGTADHVAGVGLGSASASLSSGSSSVSSDDPNIDHGQLGFHRGYMDTKISPRSPQPRSPGPGSRVPTASTSPLHPRFNGGSLDSPNKRLDDGKSECHPLPLPPGSPTSPSALHNSRTGVTESVHGPLSKWKKGRLLGRGTFGHVYLGFNSESGQMCAIKEVRVVADDQSSKECLKQLNQEINLLSQLSHPNIVQYYGSDLAEDSLSVYLEYVSGGSIHKLLQEYGAFREPVIQNYTRQILSGLAYLHGGNTVHRDIKGANILVDPNGEIKLADFGMAKHMKTCSSMLSFKGSPYWMAPEVVMNTVTNTNGYGLAVDIWSLGCTILEMATSKPPWGQYEGVAAIFKIGNSKDVPEIPDHLSNDAKSFIMLCLQREPSLRPTASKLLEHPFVRDQTITRNANVSIIKEAIPSTYDGSRTPPPKDIYPNRTVISSWEGDHNSRPQATATRGPLISPRNNARTNMSLPVSPSSSPLRQYGQAYKNFLSPPHPSYAMMSQNGYNSNDMLAFPSRPNTKNTFDPWYEIPQLRAQTPPNRSPRTRPI